MLPTSTPRLALQAVAAGAHVVASPCCSTPDTLLAALGDRAREVDGVVLSAGMLLGQAAYVDAVRDGRLTCRSWHLSGPLRGLAAQGRVDYLPCRSSDAPALVSRGVDVALVRVTPPDRAGWCSVGPSASYTQALVRGAQTVVAEVDEQLPRTLGAEAQVHVSELTHLVASEHPTPTYAASPVSAESEGIAQRVVGLLREGGTLQVGIGAVPEAVAGALSRSGATGLRFVGLACSSMATMLTEGDCEVDAAEVMGDAGLHAAVDRNERVRMGSSSRIHEPRWLATLPGLVSICSALEVDLSGQVVSEEVGGRVIGGIGGSMDFFDGARMSPGGLRVVALLSTTAAGASRVVARLAAGAVVTLPRHGVDVVVTEWGVAELAGRSLRERAAALIDIAHPTHREALHEALGVTR